MIVLTNEEALANMATNLQRLMEERSKNLSQLAGETGDALATVHRAIYGKTMPNAAVLARLAQVLNVKIDDILAAPRRSRSRSA